MEIGTVAGSALRLWFAVCSGRRMVERIEWAIADAEVAGEQDRDQLRGLERRAAKLVDDLEAEQKRRRRAR